MMEVYQGALIGLGVVVALSVVAVLVFRPKYYSLECKTVVITGGSSGIGKASAQVRCYPKTKLCVPYLRFPHDVTGHRKATSPARYLQDLLGRGASVALLARREAVLKG